MHTLLFTQPDINSQIATALGKLDAWLQTMCGDHGYGGPISHWWESSLIYCGPMVDWRYEGVIGGYLSLYRSTLDHEYLGKAIQAGDDILNAQLPGGNYKNSAFQQGPMEAGTPHEAAVDAGLLELAQQLKLLEHPGWTRYFHAAEKNLQEFHLGCLWGGKGFLDQSWHPILVPNKNATTIEALILYEELSGRDMSEYIDGALDAILTAQEKVGARPGAIVHRGTGRHKLAIGIYTARSVSGLMKAYQREPREDVRACAGAALGFLQGLVTPTGNLFGRYADGSPIASPKMIAGSGDVLRAMALGSQMDLADEMAVEAQVKLLLAAQTAAGGIPTAAGFARRGSQRHHPGVPDFRDVLPVVGWCDKAFRALALLSSQAEVSCLQAYISGYKMDCLWKNKACVYGEENEEIYLREKASGMILFHWHKGAYYPEIYRL